MIKAVAGGSGRGMRAVNGDAELAVAYERCRSEAEAAFGCGDVYLERRVANARHVEVQIIGDGRSVSHVWERECTLQRRHQKLVEVAPSPTLSVPFFTIILRKGYGLGAQAMAGGSFKAPFFTVSWPTGEFGGMGLEGAVKLGYRKELAAMTDPDERRALYEEMVARMYEHGKAVNMASHFEIDDVIDPMDSRHLITRALRSVPPVSPRTGKKRPCVDPW